VIKDAGFTFPEEFPKFSIDIKDKVLSLPHLEWKLENLDDCIVQIKKVLGPTDELIALMNKQPELQKQIEEKSLDLKIEKDTECDLSVMINTIDSCYSEYPLSEVKSLQIRCTLGENCIKTLNEKCPKLEKFNLFLFTLNANKDLKDDMFKGIKNLSICHVVGAGVTDKTLHYIADGSPNLTNIDVSYCNKMTDKGMRYLIDHCPKLKTVYMRTSGNTEYTGKILQYVAEKLGTQLEHFGFQGPWNNVVDDEFIAVATSCPKLTYVSIQLEDNPNITDKGIVAFVDHLPNLNEFNIWNYTQFEYETLKKIFSKKSIKLMKMTNSMLKKHDPKIFNELHDEVEELDLMCWDDKVDAAAVKVIAERCPKLKKFSGYRSLSEESKAYLMEKIPTIELK